MEYVVHCKTATGKTFKNAYQTLPDLLRALPGLAQLHTISKVEKRAPQSIALTTDEQNQVSTAIGRVTRRFDLGVVR